MINFYHVDFEFQDHFVDIHAFFVHVTVWLAREDQSLNAPHNKSNEDSQERATHLTAPSLEIRKHLTTRNCPHLASQTPSAHTPSFDYSRLTFSAALSLSVSTIVRQAASFLRSSRPHIPWTRHHPPQPPLLTFLSAATISCALFCLALVTHCPCSPSRTPSPPARYTSCSQLLPAHTTSPPPSLLSRRQTLSSSPRQQNTSNLPARGHPPPASTGITRLPGTTTIENDAHARSR